MAEPADLPDERLKLMFVCTHPAIDPAARAPLMLQTMLGLTAERIAGVFLVAPAAMTKRLTRAKAKILASGIAFEVPDTTQADERVDALLDAIYAAFGIGWDDLAPLEAEPLDREAVWLGRLLVDLLPGDARAKGLLALMLFSFARRNARRDGIDGRFVALDRQNMALWDHVMLDEAERLLRGAGRANRPDRFQLEAAIQAVHVDRRRTGRTDWDAIAALYEGLVSHTPSLGGAIGHAVAIGERDGPTAGLVLLDGIRSNRITNHQPYWAARAHLFSADGKIGAASEAYAQAISLTTDPAARRFLIEQRKRLLN